MGERGLKYTKLSSFFPSEKSPFYKNAKKKPDKYVAMLQELENPQKAVVRVIISDMKINLAMLIDDFYLLYEGR